jgi:hypothetical protein
MAMQLCKKKGSCWAIITTTENFGSGVFCVVHAKKLYAGSFIKHEFSSEWCREMQSKISILETVVVV